MDRAYSVLEIKAFDADRRVFAGMATTPDLDRQGHSVDPAGVSFSNPLPLLFHHDQTQPIGTVTLSMPTAEGVAFEAEIPVITEPGRLRDRVDEAWQSIKGGLIRGMSCGLRILERQKQGNLLRLTKSEILELSLVTIPANLHASILTVKSCATPANKECPAMKQTTTEQITAFENKRAALSARQVDLMSKAAEGGVTLDDEQSTEYDSLTTDITGIDAHLVRLRALEQVHKAAAVAVETKPAMPYKPGVISVKANVPGWLPMVRLAQAKIIGNGIDAVAAEYAARWRDSTPEVELALKAATAAGTTTDATWAGPLAPMKPLQEGFLEFLRPMTILGKIPNFRRVPFNISVPAQTGGGAYSWVGQGAPKPVTKLAFGTVTLGITKCAAIIVITEELARNSTPSAEAVIRDDMVNGIAQFLDIEFTDPTKAAVSNVSPGSVTNGVTPITSAGTSPANGRTDVAALISQMTTNLLSVSQAVLIMSESNAATLSNSLNALGQPLFPTLSATGGSALGIPVIASQAVGANVILVHAPSILLADDGGVTIDASREASLQMDTAPMNPPDATVVMTSLWQMNYVGLRAERFINWKKARTGAVSYTVQTYVG